MLKKIGTVRMEMETFFAAKINGEHIIGPFF
jgi:hypothetical protein